MSSNFLGGAPDTYIFDLKEFLPEDIEICLTTKSGEIIVAATTGLAMATHSSVFRLLWSSSSPVPVIHTDVMSGEDIMDWFLMTF